MRPRPRLFLDTSVVFAALLSPTDGSRLLLKLGEAGVCQLVVGRRLLTEVDAVVRRKAPDQHGLLALLLDRANFEIGHEPTHSDLELATTVASKVSEAHVVAEAVAAAADRFVTLERTHLQNLSDDKSLALVLESPDDCVAWLRGRLGNSPHVES